MKIPQVLICCLIGMFMFQFFFASINGNAVVELKYAILGAITGTIVGIFLDYWADDFMSPRH